MAYSLDYVANLLDVASEDVALAVREAIAPLQQTQHYHYVAKPRGEGTGEGASQRPIHVLLFRSPDDALAFAKQVRIAETPRVRPISNTAALLHLLAEPRVVRVIFLEQSLDTIPAGLTRQSLGTLPGAYVIERAALLASLLI